MSEPWSVEGAARELCGCQWCRHACLVGDGPDCQRAFAERCLKAGLTHAAEVAAANDACCVCEAELTPAIRPRCDDCVPDEYIEPVATADLIRALLEERR